MSNILQRARRMERVMRGRRTREILAGVMHKAAQVMNIDAIPIEQLKGDLARQGHPVKQATALDADNRRLFFTDGDDQHLFAEFAGADDGHKILKIGHQATIAKDYDPMDLEPSGEKGNLGESVTTTHEEEDFEEESAVLPGATVVDMPEEDDRGFSADEGLVTRKSLLKELEDHLGRTSK